MALIKDKWKQLKKEAGMTTQEKMVYQMELAEKEKELKRIEEKRKRDEKERQEREALKNLEDLKFKRAPGYFPSKTPQQRQIIEEEERPLTFEEIRMLDQKYSQAEQKYKSDKNKKDLGKRMATCIDFLN